MFNNNNYHNNFIKIKIKINNYNNRNFSKYNKYNN